MWNIIPQLFYDFLARIVPGTTLIILAALIIFGYDSIFADEQLKQITSINFCLWLLGSYLVGFVMGQISEMVLKRFLKKRYNSIEKEHKQTCLDQHNKVLSALGKQTLSLKVDDLPIVPFMRDHLRHIEPADAARLLKVRSERRFCEVLVVGFVIIWIVDLAFLFVGRNTERIILLFSLPLLVAVLWRRALRAHKHLTGGTTVGWLFRVLPKF